LLGKAELDVTQYIDLEDMTTKEKKYEIPLEIRIGITKTILKLYLTIINHKFSSNDEISDMSEMSEDEEEDIVKILFNFINFKKFRMLKIKMILTQ
jgi:hypothetical protein